MSRPAVPLFLCHANCCRSVLASYLYRHLGPGALALSAGLDPGEQINDRALGMLACWGIDARGHRPRRLDHDLCDAASALFVMAPAYLRRLLEYGPDLASKAYLFADPFGRPESFGGGEYTVWDPSFDERPARELIEEYAWMRERVVEIRQALLGGGRPLTPASDYLDLLESVDPRSH